MIDQIYNEIKVWAGVDTWHTSHPLDTKRFYIAVNNVANNIGTNIDEADFRAALKKHVQSSSAGIDPGPFYDQIERYTDKAITILEYLDQHG